MRIQDIHVGQRVRDIKTNWELIVVGVGVINLDMDSPYVYCDFEGNEGDVWEYDPEELEAVEDGQ